METKRKTSVTFVLKILVTLILLAVVVYQIPWDDRVYILSGEPQVIAEVEGFDDGIVSLRTPTGDLINGYINRPLMIETNDQQTWWWMEGIPASGEALQAIPLKIVSGRLQKDYRSGMQTDQLTLSTSQGDLKVFTSDQLAGGFDFGIEPGFPTLLLSLNLKIFFVAFFLFILCHVVPAFRWLILMRARGLDAPWWFTVRLCYMGYFFSQVMPGTTGGDVVRAIYIARNNQDRATAALSVLLDRIVGLFGIAIIGAIAVIVQFKDPRISQYGELMMFIVVSLFVGACIYFSRKLRRWFRVDFILDKLPLKEKIRQLESKIFVYREHKMAIFKAFMLTGIIQVNFIVVSYLLALSLGLERGHLGDFFVFMPIITVLVAFPISFGGFGFREYLYVKFFAIFGLNAGLGFAASLLLGAVTLVWSLVGGLAFLSLKKEKVSLEQLDSIKVS